MKKKYLIMISGAILIVSSVFIAIEASANGAEMRLLQEEGDALLREKSDLEQVLVKGMSSNEIASKSAELGFIKPTEIVYLNGDASKNQALINTLSR